MDNRLAALRDTPRRSRPIQQSEPAGFWFRTSAYLIDTSMAFFPASILASIVTHGQSAALAATQAHALSSYTAAEAYVRAVAALAFTQGIWAFAIMVLIYGIGSVVSEAGPHQATWGKRFLGLRAQDVSGSSLTHIQAGARFLAGTVSWLTLNLGHCMAMFRADHRALHDLIAHARVIADPMPKTTRIGRAWACVAAAIALSLIKSIIAPSDMVLKQAFEMVLNHALGGASTI
jgi:uncharacterized RDD family membrane protein YckC